MSEASFFPNVLSQIGFPWWHSGKASACQCRRCKRLRFDPWIEKTHWRRKWQTAPVLLPGEFHGQKVLVDYSPQGPQESDMTEQLSTHTHWVKLLSFSRPVVSNSLQSHGLQHTRPPCPSPSPRVFPSSCSSHLWCRPAISPYDALFSYSPQSFPASRTFPMSLLFTSDDQNTGASASPSILPVNIQGWSPLRLTGLISLLSKGLSGVFSSTTVWSHQFFGILPSLQSNSHKCKWPLGRP